MKIDTFIESLEDIINCPPDPSGTPISEISYKYGRIVTLVSIFSEERKLWLKTHLKVSSNSSDVEALGTGTV